MENNTDMIFDLHSHILPVDDGVRNLNDAMETLQKSYDQGVRYIFATPHSFAFHNGSRNVEQFFENLCNRTAKELPGMHLQFGCEVLCSADRMEDILEDLRCGSLQAMGDSRYVLSEFWPSTKTKEIEYCVESLTCSGWNPIIAHVERYPRLFDNLDDVRMIHKKALFQINAYSIVEEKNEIIKSHAQWLLREKLVDFLGSDTHGMGHRPPMWEKAKEYIEQNFNEEYANKLKYKNILDYFGAEER